MKKIFFYSVLILLPWLIMEGFFRLLPVSGRPYILPVSAADPAAHYQPNVDYLFSKGWNFAIRTKQHTNNYGYNNVSDYNPDERSPLFMVIGDSYVEAHQVDSGKSAAEILNAQVSGRGRVYSMGLSGAALPQYLAYAEFAKTTFHPDAMAFVIIENDFDESLLKYKSELRLHYLHYFEESEGQLSLRRIDFEFGRDENPKEICVCTVCCYELVGSAHSQGDSSVAVWRATELPRRRPGSAGNAS